MSHENETIYGDVHCTKMVSVLCHTRLFFSEFFYIAVALHQSSLVESSAAESVSLCDRGDTKWVVSLMCLVQAACRNNVQKVYYCCYYYYCYCAFVGYNK